MRYAAIFIGGVGRRRALAESDRVSARRDACQAVQRSQRSLERQWPLYSVGLGARGGRPEEIGGFGRRALAASREEQLIDALAGSPQPMHRELLLLQLERLQLLHEQIARLNGMIAQALRPYQEVVARLADLPGFGVDSRAAGDFRSGRTGQHRKSPAARESTPNPGSS